MYQFARLLTLQGDPRETMAWATETTAYVNDNTDLDVSLWSATFGHPLGTVAWSTIVEGRAQLQAETAKLLADDAYYDLVSKAQDWVNAPAEDVFRQLVHGTPPEEPAPIGAVASVTEAVAAAGRLADAMAWATDMAEHASDVGGAQVALLVSAYGVFGSMAFISVMPDMAAVDAATESLRADDGYMSRLANAAGLFVEGSARAALLTRVA